jgi:hypothetical protein
VINADSSVVNICGAQKQYLLLKNHTSEMNYDIFVHIYSASILILLRILNYLIKYILRKSLLFEAYLARTVLPAHPSWPVEQALAIPL